ncbi:MAG: hypothetical protein AAF492_19845 [Verrucomicrobiota bacterium]
MALKPYSLTVSRDEFRFKNRKGNQTTTGSKLSQQERIRFAQEETRNMQRRIAQTRNASTVSIFIGALVILGLIQLVLGVFYWNWWDL